MAAILPCGSVPADAYLMSRLLTQAVLETRSSIPFDACEEWQRSCPVRATARRRGNALLPLLENSRGARRNAARRCSGATSARFGAAPPSLLLAPDTLAPSKGSAAGGGGT